MPSELETFFQSYVQAFNRSLGDKVDAKGIARHFADSFIGSGPAGVREERRRVHCHPRAGLRLLQADRHRADGRPQGRHCAYRCRAHLATVSYRPHYRKKDGQRIQIDFTVSYFVRTADHGPLTIGFVSADETAVFRQHGLID